MNAHEYAVYVAEDLCDPAKASLHRNPDLFAAVVSAIEHRLADPEASIEDAYHAGFVEAKERALVNSIHETRVA